jgi:hypothetical protein
MRRELIVVAAALLVCGLGAIWFLSNFDRVSYQEWTGMSGAALRNPFLAAQRLAARMGLPAAEIRSAAQFGTLPVRGTLVLPALREALGGAERARLLDWVSRGGHLFIEAEPRHTPDPLLDALGVARAPSVATAPGARSKQSPYLWPGREQGLEVTLYPEPALVRPGTSLALTRDGRNAMVHFTRGDGAVTVVSNLRFARNGSIGTMDNAELFWQLVSLQPEAASLAVFNRPERLSLLRWLLEHAWPALAALAALTLLWLLHVAPRFGPMTPEGAPARRRLLDHLRASGRFAWSAGRASHLAAAARDTAMRRFARHHPELVPVDSPQRIERFAAALGLTVEDAQHLVVPHAPRTPVEFVRLITLAQRVHEQLAHAGKPTR